MSRLRGTKSWRYDKEERGSTSASGVSQRSPLTALSVSTESLGIPPPSPSYSSEEPPALLSSPSLCDFLSPRGSPPSPATTPPSGQRLRPRLSPPAGSPQRRSPAAAAPRGPVATSAPPNGSWKAERGPGAPASARPSARPLPPAPRAAPARPSPLPGRCRGGRARGLLLSVRAGREPKDGGASARCACRGAAARRAPLRPRRRDPAREALPPNRPSCRSRARPRRCLRRLSPAAVSLPSDLPEVIMVAGRSNGRPPDPLARRRRAWRTGSGRGQRPSVRSAAARSLLTSAPRAGLCACAGRGGRCGCAHGCAHGCVRPIWRGAPSACRGRPRRVGAGGDRSGPCRAVPGLPLWLCFFSQ